MKTAISIPDDIFKEIESYAREIKCSRSEVFTRAVKEFLERRRSEKMLESLNRIYQEEDRKENEVLSRGKKYFRDEVLEE
ncbi:MAG: hypothetical protein D6726_10005 [Nitrospirae bacterium]|nr:MAG: hypothetical protein D6726_10005 [Nitrospirota bacterium]